MNRKILRRLINRKAGKRLGVYRKLRGIPINVFAAKLGIKPRELRKYETGRKTLCAGQMIMIAVEVEIPVEYFYHKIEVTDVEILEELQIRSVGYWIRKVFGGRFQRQ